MDGDTNDLAKEHSLPQAMAFTVTFNTDRVLDNRFVKRHIRNLSLPIPKASATITSPEINGKAIACNSEGYYSSDTEEDPSKASNVNNLNDGCPESSGGSEGGNIGHNDDSDDNVSETGTFTVEEPADVLTARLNIETAFGILPNAPSKVITSRDSPHWVAEWATNVVTHNNSSGSSSVQTTASSHHQGNNHRPLRPTSAPRQLHGSSKIPSPVVTRAKLGNRTTRPHSDSAQKPSNLKQSGDEAGDEAEKHLRTTERVMEALAARLSLDSESEEAGGVSGSGHRSTDSSASESGRPPPTPAPQTQDRFNRAFNLRRNRADNKIENNKGSTATTLTARKEVSTASDVPLHNSTNNLSSQSAGSGVAVFKKPLPLKQSTCRTTPVLSRTDPGRFSMRQTNPKSPQLSESSKVPGVLKKKTTNSSGGGRSNSTLSSKEVEFQNWKRRKSYDPMKAAAEGKKTREARKSTGSSLSQSHNSTSQQPPTGAVSGNVGVGNSGGGGGTVSVLRSASFHGTRQLQGTATNKAAITSSSEEDDHSNGDWPPILQAPRCSRETTPLGSRVSLCSNNSNSPQPGRHKLEGVDNLVVSAISNLSCKLKLGGSTLLRKLKCLYDEDSLKGKQLLTEIELLEASSGSNSPHRSASKELASTLRNLKRLESMLKVLDEVMFDDTEYE